MVNEEMTLERFRKIVSATHQKGETGLLIWKSPQERDLWGKKEEVMWVEDPFEVHGFFTNGNAYGEYKNMELTRAIKNAFRCNYAFNLMTTDGKGLAAKAFQIEQLLSREGHLIFAQRDIFFRHLSGPIVSIPSYQVILE